ncbi:hypothetical protein KKC97_04380 [bacterium]|nr:hypothetical protein [bacterium]MBU1636884.1 hypothetical protein [bacterium]
MTDQKDSWEGMFWKAHKYNERVKIKSGTFLNSFCPHCGKELTSHNILELEVVNAEGKQGKLELSPYLNQFDLKTDIQTPDDQEVQDLKCPHCHESLVVEGGLCSICKSHIAGFQIGSANAKVPFFICMKKGCHWHSLSRDDSDTIILDDSDEW